MRRPEENISGFTLIEVIVALAILSISFVLVMELFSVGLRSARTSCDYTRAIVLAKGKMEEMPGVPVNDSGDLEDGFRWETEVQDYKIDEGSGRRLLKVKVKVLWDSALKTQRSFELTSLRSVSDDEKL
ncbi:MAG: prepilin-type N-terminal cleavage/methylation domain-containing protein [Nitrospirota bacterium]|nr:prepilin-type N-terminal cleavage/methylation domain-containing protein [Nitrospirota bacterium]